MNTDEKDLSPPTNSGLRGRFRRLVPFLWTAALAFLAGVLLIWITLLAPRTADLAQTREELASANGQIDEQLDEIARLNEIETQLEQEQTRLDIFRFIAEINNARLALAANDLNTAQSILSVSQSSWEVVAEALEADFGSQVNEISLRLELAVQGVSDGDAAIALSDLDLLVNELLVLEKEIGA